MPETSNYTPRGWKVEKTISYSDIITTFAMLAMVGGVFISSDRRIEENAANIRSLALVQEQNDRRQDDLRERIEARMASIDGKIDVILTSMRNAERRER